MSNERSNAEQVFPHEQTVGAGYTLAVHVGGGAVHFLPHPAADPHLEWMLRYRPNGLDDKRNSARLAAASVLAGIDYLCSEEISMKEATRRLRLLRAAMRDATQKVSPNAALRGVSAQEGTDGK